jgi:hypothetical protein
LRVVDRIKLSTLDWTGAAIVLCGIAVIVFGWSRGWCLRYCMAAFTLRLQAGNTL